MSRGKDRGRRFKSSEGAFSEDYHVRITKNMTSSVAFKSLSGNAAKLYVYMRMWAGREETFDYAASMASGFMCPHSFFRARDELIKKGFIVFENQTGAKYKHETCHFSFSDRWQIWKAPPKNRAPPGIL